jgi:predicted NBD/HSP70 family sugar kinase
MNASMGSISLTPNIRHFSELNVVGSLLERFGLNVLVENNVNLGLLGEIWHGCAQRLSDVVFIALGAGIGLGLCANGKCAGLAVLPGRSAISDWRRSAPRGGSRPRLPRV